LLRSTNCTGIWLNQKRCSLRKKNHLKGWMQSSTHSQRDTPVWYWNNWRIMEKS
jgi:hypothetical protein